MSYQEYAQLGRGTRRNTINQQPPQTRRPRANTIDRPYTGSTASFSIPRATAQHSNSSSTSTASISPSNSVSQQDTLSSSSGPTSTEGTAEAAASHRAIWAQMKELEFGSEKQPTLVDVPLPWRPFYLQRKILIAFVGIFAGLVVALEALGDFSGKNDGLGPGDTTLRYAWAYTPAALLTLLAALWGRVEHQAKSAAPWIRMSKGPAPAEKTLLLDYVGMIRPVAFVRAIGNGDAVVASTVAVSLILRALTVLSTALVTISVVGARRGTVPITLQSAFIDDATGLANAGPLSFYGMLGLQQENVSFPDGASSRFAYQQFTTDVPAGSVVDASVEGVSAGLECEDAQLAVTGVQYDEPNVQFNTTVNAAGCSVSMPINSGVFVGTNDSSAEGTKYFARLSQGGCGGSSDVQDQRIVVVYGVETIDRKSLPTDPNAGTVPIAGAISLSAQLLCKPTYTISRLEARRNATDLLSLEMLDPPQNRTLEKVQPWDIAQAVLSSFRTDLASGLTDTTPSFYEPEFVNVDAPMYLALGELQRSSGSVAPPSAFLDGSTLRSLAGDYFQQHAALLASKAMIIQNATLATGAAVLQGERVVVRFITVQLMAALLGVAIILTVVATFLVPRKGFLPRDPNTIIDTATLIAHSRPLLQTLRGAGGGSSAVLRERLNGSEYHMGVEPYDTPSSTAAGYFKIVGSGSAPETGADFVQRNDKFPFPIALHPVVRVAAFLLVVGTIVCLEIPLRMSQSNGGLADAVDEGAYTYFVWTAAPALVVLLFAAYFAYADFTTRALAPYAALRRGGSFESSVNLNYLDKATPMALFESVKSRNIAVAMAAIALLTSSLLVASVAPVFSVATVPATSPVQLISRDASSQASSNAEIDACADCPANGAVIASLILNANLSYPAFTYEALSFPTLATASVLDNSTIPGDAIISAVVKAVRPVMGCRVFKQSEIATSIVFDRNNSPLQINIPDGGSDSGAAPTLTINTAGPATANRVIPQDAFFGAADRRQIALEDGTVVSNWVYAWGQLSDANTTKTTVKTISAMSCNETVEQIDAFVTFFGSSLAILPSNPPFIDPSSKGTPVTSPPDATNFYSQLANISTPHLLDPFFASLINSRYFPEGADLGNSDPDAAQNIASIIVGQHEIIRTQILREFSQASRRSTGTKSDVGDAAAGDIAVARIPAMLTEGVLRTTGANTGSTRAAGTDAASSPLSPLTARRRIVQDMAATRVLQGLLGATALFALVSWFTFPGPSNVLPRTPGGVGGAGSIASTAALLADGNSFGWLGRQAEWQPTSRLRDLFMDGLHVSMDFRLGWEAPRRRRREETLAAWGMNGSSGGPEELFGIGAVRTGGWGGGEAVGLGLQARVGFGHRNHVKDWGWRT